MKDLVADAGDSNLSRMHNDSCRGMDSFEISFAWGATSCGRFITGR